MEKINEDLLDVWLTLSRTIINDRLVSDMPYNEARICNILYRNQRYHPQQRLTATNLCNETNMLKSQMNRTLNQMEKKGLIIRERSSLDKRNVFISLDPQKAEVYIAQHTKILELVDRIIEKIGKEKTMELIELLTTISAIAHEVIK